MKGIIFLGCCLASLVMLFAAGYIFFTIQECLAKWWLGGTCLVAGIVYGILAYTERHRRLYNFD